jgi:20S proteasome alpha/beta subunit
MTTLAYKDGVVAADTMSVIDKMKWSMNCKKVFKLKNGNVVGFAGTVAYFKPAVDLLNRAIVEAKNKQSVNLPDLPKGLYAMLASKNRLYIWYGKSGWGEDRLKAFAHGPGSEYAQGALDAGASAPEAIRSAIKRDLYTGGRVQYVEVS